MQACNQPSQYTIKKSSGIKGFLKGGALAVVSRERLEDLAQTI
jgi:hypothetical protein